MGCFLSSHTQMVVFSSSAGADMLEPSRANHRELLVEDDRSESRSVVYSEPHDEMIK